MPANTPFFRPLTTSPDSTRDIISQTLLAVPIYLLFELGILLAKIYVVKEDDSDEETAATE